MNKPMLYLAIIGVFILSSLFGAYAAPSFAPIVGVQIAPWMPTILGGAFFGVLWYYFQVRKKVGG